MVTLSKIDETMSTYIKPQTYPVAVKMLKNEEEIPKDAQRPLEDFGHAFTLCQALALGRKEGLTIVLDRNSQSCPIAMVGLGFVRPDAYLSGRYMVVPINMSPEARRKAAASMPRFEFGQFNSIVIAPIQTARFDPDVIIFYGSGTQVMRMIQGAVFESGEALTSKSVGSGGCLLTVVAPVLEGVCKYCVPGNGERRVGLIADGEVGFAMPRNRFEEVMAGLALSHEGKQTYPISPGYLLLDYKMPPFYEDLRKVLLESSKG
jgi:uncharacterized protein (DUF169 family)